MNILISGSTGLIGSALVPYLITGGYAVKHLVRKTPKSEHEIAWNPNEDSIDRDRLEGLDAVIHLAGEGITGRWTEEKKRKIMNSRKAGTNLLAATLAGLSNPPKVLISASAIGYYGDRGNELLTEDASPGVGFLSEVCKEWETALAPAAEKGIRTASLRIGIALSSAGGALAQMLTPFRLGAGGNIGSGKQWWSWVAIDDVIGMIQHVLMSDSITGPVNAVTPNPVTNAEFARILGKVLKRPAIFPLPSWAAKIALGEMADALLLASSNVVPAKLIATNYPFRYPELEGALRHLLD
jgi:uncharacterized protein (TIGR01777 family)